MRMRALLMVCMTAGGALPLTGCLGDMNSGYYAPAVAPLPVVKTDRSSYTAFGDSITCGYVGAGATTVSPYSINDASCHTVNAYPSYMAPALQLVLANYAIPANQACDLWVREIAPENVNPIGKPLYTVLIGTNDAGARGPGIYETVFKACSLAALTWLAIPLQNKALPPAATANGWTLGSSAQFGAYATTQTPGATLTFDITTNGGPIYLWHNLFADTPGFASYSVDGVAVGQFSTQPTVLVTLSTINGTENSVAGERIAGVAAGMHKVTITDLGGELTVMGIGTPPLASAAQPLVLAGQCPLTSTSVTATLMAALDAYSADTLALATMLSSDGLNVVYAPNHNYMTGSAAELIDSVHMSPLGASHLAEAFIAVTPHS